MLEYTRRTRTVVPLALAALSLALGACGRDERNPLRDSGLAADSALNRDLQLAGGDTAAQPQLQDVPATPPPSAEPASTPPPTRTAPRTTAPRTTTPRSTASRPAPAPPRETTTPSGNVMTRNTGTEGTAARGTGGAVGSIPAGSVLSLASNGKVCTNTNQVGDVFTAELTDGVTGSNGASLPRGSVVTLRVTRLERSDNIRDPIRMEFDVVSVKVNGVSYPLDGAVTAATVTEVNDQPKNKDVQKVVGGAVVGAIAGQILGKNTKSTVIGAATGAAAGAAVAKATANRAGCVNQGASISVKLNAPVQVKV